MKIFYMGLESYQARYTYQLTDWTKRAYDKRNIDYVIVPGEQIDDSEAIVTGQVLDAHGRSYFGMSQMMNLVKMLKAGDITSKDIIFFETCSNQVWRRCPTYCNRLLQNINHRYI